jgi:hypothetical protein
VARQAGAEGIKRATAKGERRLAMKELQESVQANAFIPRSATLEDWSNKEWTDGVQINALRELDVLSVETKHHTYEITIFDPNTAEVMIRGGDIFPEASTAQVLGASIGGSFLKLHGIYLGFKIELRVGRRHIVTSPVRSISIVGC